MTGVLMIYNDVLAVSFFFLFLFPRVTQYDTDRLIIDVESGLTFVKSRQKVYKFRERDHSRM